MKRESMINEKEFQKNILSEIETSVSVWKCMEDLIVILFLLLLLYFLSVDYYVILILGIIPVMFHIGAVIILAKNGKIEGAKKLLYKGVFSIAFSFEFELLGLVLLTFVFSEKYKLLIIGIGCIIYILAIILYLYLIKYFIEEKSYGGEKKTNGAFTGAFFGMLGMLTARIFLTRIDSNVATILVSILCLLISLLLLFGISDIVKFSYIRNNKEQFFSDVEV